jgi:hypothetical protein
MAQPGNFTDVGVKGRPSLDPNEKSFSVAISELKKAVKDSHGVEPDMKEVRGYVDTAALPDGVFGPSDTAAELVKTWNKAMNQRQKELKAMYNVVIDLPDRLAKTIENYLKAETDTAGEIDYFSKFEDHYFDQAKDYSDEWSADPGWSADPVSGSGDGADSESDSGPDGAAAPEDADVNEVP